MKMQHSLANGRQHNTHTHKWSVRELCAAPGRHATPCHVRYALGHFASANIQTHWTHTQDTPHARHNQHVHSTPAVPSQTVKKMPETRHKVSPRTSARPSVRPPVPATPLDLRSPPTAVTSTATRHHPPSRPRPRPCRTPNAKWWR